MIGRRMSVLAGAALVLTSCASHGSSSPEVTHCGHSANGVVCIVVVLNGSRVGDVIGYYSPAQSLVGRSWRLELVRYGCDPAVSNSCRPEAEYPAPARHRPPPRDETCAAVVYDNGKRQCTTRLAEALGSVGDWAGLPSLPSATLARQSWLCVSAQLAQTSGWQDQFARSAACYH